MHCLWGAPRLDRERRPTTDQAAVSPSRSQNTPKVRLSSKEQGISSISATKRPMYFHPSLECQYGKMNKHSEADYIRPMITTSRGLGKYHLLHGLNAYPSPAGERTNCHIATKLRCTQDRTFNFDGINASIS